MVLRSQAMHIHGIRDHDDHGQFEMISPPRLHPHEQQVTLASWLLLVLLRMACLGIMTFKCRVSFTAAGGRT